MPPKPTGPTPFQDAVRETRSHAIATFWFQGLVSLSSLVYPIYMIQVYERVVPSRNLASLLAVLTGAVIVMIFAGFFTYIARQLPLNASLRVDRLLGASTFRALILRSSAEQTETGAQILRDLATARAYYTRTRPAALVGAPWMALFLGVLFLMNFWIGVAAVICLAIEIGLTFWNSALTKNARQTSIDKGIDSMRMVDANIRSADAVVAMGMLPGLVAKWRTLDDDAVAAEAKGGRTTAIFHGFNSAFSVIMTMLVLSVAVVAIIEGQLAPGFAFACVLAFNFMMRPLRDIIGAWEKHDEARIAAERVDRLLAKYGRRPPTMPLPKPSGQLGCRRVSYVAPGGAKPILQAVTFGIEPATTVGVVGSIGSGKTTLIRLLVGLARPTQGEVRLDGVSLAEWDPDELGRHIGYLPQDISLINGSVAENIGRLGLFDETQIVAAAQRAGVHNMILKLAQGYDTIIGDGGVRLSGGQKQLIGLARAIVGDPSLLVLDEPNSNLDGPGETALAACVAQMKKAGATVILVSHRPNLVQDLDRVLLLRDGGLAFDGPVDKFFEMSGRSNVRLLKQGAGAP